MKDEKKSEIMEVPLPIHTHFNTPDVNGIIFSKDTYIKAIEKANEIYKNQGGIPVVAQDEPKSLNDLFVNPARIIGRISNIDMENMTGDLTINPDLTEYAEHTAGMIKAGANLSFGLRGMGSFKFNNDHTFCNIERITSFSLIDCDTNPCESILVDEDNNARIVEELEMIYNDEKCRNGKINGTIKISSPGADKFKSHLNESHNIHVGE